MQIDLNQLIQEHGFSGTLVVAFGWLSWKMFLKYDKKNDQNEALMKDQIDKLAKDNNDYRRYFLKNIKGMDDKTLEDIFPEYNKGDDDSPINREVD